jgi:hypothetical protein
MITPACQGLQCVLMPLIRPDMAKLAKSSKTVPH